MHGLMEINSSYHAIVAFSALAFAFQMDTLSTLGRPCIMNGTLMMMH